MPGRKHGLRHGLRVNPRAFTVELGPPTLVYKLLAGIVAPRTPFLLDASPPGRQGPTKQSPPRHSSALRVPHVHSFRECQRTTLFAFV